MSKLEMSTLQFKHGITGQLQQLLNQFVGKQIDDHLMGQVKLAVQNLLAKSMANATNFKVEVVNYLGTLRVDINTVQPTQIPCIQTYKPTLKDAYKSEMWRAFGWGLNPDHEVAFYYDSRDVDVYFNYSCPLNVYLY